VANLVVVLSNNHVLSVIVTDSGSNIAAALDTLQSNAAKITAITLTDATPPTLTLTAAQLSGDASALGLIGSGYNLTVSGVAVANLAAVLGNPHVQSVSVSDSAANIAALLDTLQADIAQISAITLTDGGTPTLTLTAQQASNDAAILAKITSPYVLSTGSGVTVANLAAALANSHGQPVAVADSAANISAALNTLKANVAKLSGITLTDKTTPTLSIAASQFAPDAAVLGKITSPYKLALTDKGIPAIALTASQYSQDSAQLGKISTPYSLKISGETVANLSADLNNSHASSVGIADSAANVLAVLDTLVPNAAKLSGITLTDASTPTLAISAGQFAHDGAVLGKISSAYILAISAETAANVAVDAKNSHVSSIAVADTAAHVSASLSSLASNANKLSGITLTDKATPTLSLSAVQVTADLGVLNAISSPYLLSVKDTVANINNLNLSGVHDNQIEIMPTSLLATLTENTQITDLNLAQIKLTGDSITEKPYQGSGTEVDIVNSKGAVINQLLFTHDSEAQLQLLGIGSTVVHVM